MQPATREQLITKLLPHVGREYLFQLDKLTDDELHDLLFWLGYGATISTASDLMRSGHHYFDFATARRAGEAKTIQAYQQLAGRC